MRILHFVSSLMLPMTAVAGTPATAVASPVPPSCFASAVTPIVRAATSDTTKPASQDSAKKGPPIFEPSLRYGIDSTVSPCADFYQYANGGWRANAVLPSDSTPSGTLAPAMLGAFNDIAERAMVRLRVILDSAHSVAGTTKDPTLKALGNFYASCLAVDSLERVPKRASTRKPTRDSTRAEQCVQRTLANLGGALGQWYATDKLTPATLAKMQQLLDGIHAAVAARLEANKWMSATEKELTLERLRKLHLRIGIPKELVDYQPMALTAADYNKNKIEIANFGNQQWVNSIGGNIREQWKSSLLTANAFYRPSDHAIEVPALMFLTPFFDAKSEDALNYSGIGMVIGHEIFHSISPQFSILESPELKTQIQNFKTFHSGLGTVDGWGTNGERTFNEDVADFGGVRVAYTAWKKATEGKKNAPAAKVDGYTPDQRFFLGFARLWRAKWRGTHFNSDVHGAPFARINGTVMQMPEFAKAFGCKEGDKMFVPPSKQVVIW